MSNIDYKKLLADIGLRGMSVEEFAILLAAEGIRFASKARLNEAFRDLNPKPLRDDVAEQVARLWAEIESMCFDFLPFPLDVTNGARTHVSLQLYRGLKALKGDENKIVVPQQTTNALGL